MSRLLLRFYNARLGSHYETGMTEERLIDIESKLAHQDQLLFELNDVITKQQEKIMRLETLCESIVERVRALGEAQSADESSDERPPHY